MNLISSQTLSANSSQALLVAERTLFAVGQKWRQKSENCSEQTKSVHLLTFYFVSTSPYDYTTMLCRVHKGELWIFAVNAQGMRLVHLWPEGGWLWGPLLLFPGHECNKEMLKFLKATLNNAMTLCSLPSLDSKTVYQFKKCIYLFLTEEPDIKNNQLLHFGIEVV